MTIIFKEEEDNSVVAEYNNMSSIPFGIGDEIRIQLINHNPETWVPEEFDDYYIVVDVQYHYLNSYPRTNSTEHIREEAIVTVTVELLEE